MFVVFNVCESTASGANVIVGEVVVDIGHCLRESNDAPAERAYARLDGEHWRCLHGVKGNQVVVKDEENSDEHHLIAVWYKECNEFWLHIMGLSMLLQCLYDMCISIFRVSEDNGSIQLSFVPPFSRTLKMMALTVWSHDVAVLLDLKESGQSGLLSMIASLAWWEWSASLDFCVMLGLQSPEWVPHVMPSTDSYRITLLLIIKPKTKLLVNATREACILGEEEIYWSAKIIGGNGTESSAGKGDDGKVKEEFWWIMEGGRQGMGGAI
ncbi:hypothetical protein EV421DRAFT_1743727 [Armillaria borealis]|uniref:Uncharacterized protein n=1 Tax=Armillaria borealis TaxID=47425 RepID=A0AA39IW08_9AGAR|nr:hypothetical protein EV421DRAFT_1743727 [Armillaria borealis]